MGFESKARMVKVEPPDPNICWWCLMDTPPLIKGVGLTYHANCKKYAERVWKK